MTLRLLKLVALCGCFFFVTNSVTAQGIFTGIDGTVINLSCNQTCTDELKFQVPHLKSDEDYTVTNIPYTPYPYTTPAGNELTALYADDKYSQAITLPFPICFYGNVYTQVVVGSNGLLTFDVDNANCDGAYTVLPIIPYDLGPICNQNVIYYPKAAIMGAFSDLDPGAAASPAGRKIEWRFEGTAPFRRFVASWNRVGVYGNNSCGRATPTTFQIVINEATAVIEVFFEQKICTDGSEGNAILGVQDWSRTKAVAAPHKNAELWTAQNEGYRFVPSGASSRFIKSEIYLADGITLLNTATTDITTHPGSVDITFPSVCPSSISEDYIVKTYYSSCINPATNFVVEDKITVERDPELHATHTTTPTLCGNPSGTVTFDVPAVTTSTAPYTVTLNPGPLTQSDPAPVTVNNVPEGTYTAIITDASGNCTSTITNIIVGKTNNLAATVNAIPTACPASSDGKIQITPTTGTGPYTFVLTPGSITQTGATTTTFTVAPGTYDVSITDASGCNISKTAITVDAGPALTTPIAKTDVLCNGDNTGTITVTQPAAGTAPYEYSLDGVTWQSSNVFNGLTATTYTVYYKDANCQNSQSITINQPPALTQSFATVPVICNGENNGTITLTAGGGVSPYQYSIDGGTTWQPGNSFNLPANTYNVIIKDFNNCTITAPNIIVTEPAVLTASSANTPASCDGGNDGVITVTATGGNASYQYSLDGTTFQSSNTFNVGPDDYTVTVKDDLGCTTSFPTTVVLGSNFTMTKQTDPPAICEGSSTQLQLISNATKYEWTPKLGLSDTTIYNPVANPVVTTEYYVTATLGRCSAKDTVLVNVFTAPIPEAGPAGFICYGQTFQLQGSGGVQYSWSPSVYLSRADVADPISTPTKDITYTLSIIADVNGCPSLITDDVHIDVTPPIKVQTYPYDTIAYTGDQFYLLAVPSDNDVVDYTWSPSTGLSDPLIAKPLVTVGAVGDVVQYEVITSTMGGCIGKGYVTVRVYKGPDIYVPTGFTPNGDGRNDRFTPVPVGMKSYNYFRVFNRQGQVVFSTKTINDGWDGKVNGVQQQTGVYIWMIEGVTKDNRVITKKGTVTLIR